MTMTDDLDKLKALGVDPDRWGAEMGEPPHLQEDRLTAYDDAGAEMARRGRLQAERRAIERGDQDWAEPPVGYPLEPHDGTQAKVLTPEEKRAKAVEEYAETLRVREEGRRLYAAEKAGVSELPPRRTLREFLAETTAPRQWRVSGLLPIGGNGLLVAKAKSGKSTLVSNLIRSCVDGDHFLDRFPVRPAAGLVTLLDFELPKDTLRDWLREQGVRDEDAMEPISLKGRAGDFDIRNDATRARWAERLAGTEVLILDALSPLLGALQLAEATEAGDLLPFLDALKFEAGISELQVVHHMGHVAERARGDSRLEGWPDAIWALNTDEKTSTRYFSARGRDVDLRESALTFDPMPKRLSIGVDAGSRRDAEVEEALAAVLTILNTRGEQMGSNEIEHALDGDKDPSRAAVRSALVLGTENGELTMVSGPRRSKLYSPTTPVRRTAP